MNTPVVIRVGDYTELDIYAKAYQTVGLDLEVTEVGMENAQYVAVIHRNVPEELDFVSDLELELI